MARDFLSDQIRTTQLIGSGSQNVPKLSIYSDTEATDNIGGISSTLLNNVGDDVFLFVSGTIDGKANNTPDSVSLFAGDVVVSGTLYTENHVVEVITETTGALNVSGTINHSDGINIGNAEDGTYTDGLFTDFTSGTLLGTAIDRFNEVLKGLAPREADSLDNFDTDNTPGLSALLAFGPSNTALNQDINVVSQTNEPSPQPLGFSAVDVNGLYEPELSSGGNHKLGIFTSNTTVSGTLNEDKSSDVYSNSIVNFPENSFSKADQGSLKLFVNGTEIHTVDLTDVNVGQGQPGSGSGSYLNSNGSGFFNLSDFALGRFSSNETFATFTHRTGEWKVDSSDQRQGFNYVQVKHVIGNAEYITGFTQWVNDVNPPQLSVNNKSLSLNLSGSKHISGIEYFTGGTATYSANIENYYKYGYGNTNIDFNSSTGTIADTIISMPDFPIPTINTATEDHTKTLQISSTANINIGYVEIMNDDLTILPNIYHPYKTIPDSLITATATGVLIQSQNVTSSTNSSSIESFSAEDFRLNTLSSFNLQTDVTDSANQWDSTISLSPTNPGYDDGLLIWSGRLYGTQNSAIPNSSNFNLANSPSGNPDYGDANISAGSKFFIRSFVNNTGNPIRDLSYTLSGTGTIRNHGYSLTNNDSLKIYFKIPGQTAWLDSASSFVYNNYNTDGNGGSIGTFSSSFSGTKYVTFGTREASNSERVLVKIEADKYWTGNIDSLTVNLGAVGNVNASPNLSEALTLNNGAQGKLSFGSSLSVTNYSNVGSVGGSTSQDINDEYNISSFATNSRRGIFNGSQTISGVLNESTSSSGNNYPANSWGGGNANVGELKLELNGQIISGCTINLATFGSGNNLNTPSNTGFINITSAQPGLDSNSLPDYRYFYRTGSFQVDPSDQREGWNYVRILHDLDGGTNVYETNYVEWVNSNESIISFSSYVNDASNISQGLIGPNYLSGINYFTSVTGQFSVTASNVYKYVYSKLSNAVSFPTSTNCVVTSINVTGNGILNSSISSSNRSLPNLDTNIANAPNEDITITANYEFDGITVSLPGSLQSSTLVCQVNHPIHGNVQANSSVSPSPLIYVINDTETNLVENFSAESYRLIEGSYNNQTDISSGSWSSSQSLIGADSGHNSGLQFYNNELVAPSIDFSNSATLVGPINNPDYSTATGVRTFYRKVQNQTVSSKFNFALTLQGNGTLVANNSSLGTNNNNFRMFIKLPNTTNGQTTGWMDFRLAFQTGQVSDNSGCRTGGDPNNLTNTLSSSGTTFEGTFGTQYAFSDANQTGDLIVFKIEADSSWTGNISNIEFEWR